MFVLFLTKKRTENIKKKFSRVWKTYICV